MNKINVAAPYAIAAILIGAAVAADESVSASARLNEPAALQRAKVHHASPVIPSAEPDTTSHGVGSVSSSPFATAATTGTTLTGPATLTYSGASNAFTINNSGDGSRAISAVNSNTGNTSSALFGKTYGAGAGLTGYNAGTGGPGGKFAVVNAQSAQAGAFATTNGTGPAILGTITTTDSNYPAVYGQNTVSSNNTYGIGVEGDGGYAGVYGESPAEYGVAGYSDSGIGVYGNSNSGNGVYGASGNGYGVYGYSYTSYAGYFEGPVAANSYATLSDKNAKTDFSPIDASRILDKVSHLPVTCWGFKTDKQRRRHMGPMAQDFHAEFGLDGDDDTHINLGDMAGVTLAAVQELNIQMRQKDAQIADLKEQLAAQSEAQTKALASLTEKFSALMTALEPRDVPVQAAIPPMVSIVPIH